MKLAAGQEPGGEVGPLSPCPLRWHRGSSVPWCPRAPLAPLALYRNVSAPWQNARGGFGAVAHFTLFYRGFCSCEVTRKPPRSLGYRGEQLGAQTEADNLPSTTLGAAVEQGGKREGDIVTAGLDGAIPPPLHVPITAWRREAVGTEAVPLCQMTAGIWWFLKDGLKNKKELMESTPRRGFI